ncbi:MAG: 2-C-methyl-D-erythritol 4-phosphate cytidylyltransferase [Defluviitaleaceae bacterium]|nr:2-C-methyl-D-erythritol 4-phosphate cytidylyltransferase [Defluviitaleaceae bacterium]
MYRYLTVTAIVVAAGNGSRFGEGLPKQFLMLGNMPVLGHSLMAFDKNTYIDRIVIVVSQEHLMMCEDMVEQLRLVKPCDVVVGGANRQESVRNGLLQLDEKCMDGIVLVHDGARPFVEGEDVYALLSAAYDYQAATLGLPVTDTIKVADFEMSIEKTLQRDNLFTVQTPQAFKADVLIKAHKQAKEAGRTKSCYDDCQLVEKTGIAPKIVTGSPNNIKITHAVDIHIARSILEGEK